MLMATRRSTHDDGMALVLAKRSVPTGSDTSAMREWAERLVARARVEGVDLTGDDGLLTGILRQVLQAGLDVELEEHLGYERCDPAGRNSGNSRNGSYPKTVATEIGDVEVHMPRDRNATFEPVSVPKHARRLDGLAGNVISLYAKGLTTGDIQAHLSEMYDTTISRETISKITDQIVDDMLAWRKPTARSGLSGAADRRDREQGPRQPGREPARLRGDRRQRRWRPRRARTLVGAFGGEGAK
jgi:hypothetical protein